MTIEEKCNTLILNYAVSPSRQREIIKKGDFDKNRMGYWLWHGRPGFVSKKSTVPKPMDFAIGLLIQEADETECLTSNSEYIRECKKWFMDPKNKRCRIKKEDILKHTFKGLEINK